MKTALARAVVVGSLLTGATAWPQPLPQPQGRQLITLDGTIYQQVTVLRADPDGLLLRYVPEPAGIGLAKVFFSNLPPAVRARYGFDPERAARFQEAQAEASARWVAQSVADEAFRRFWGLGMLNRALGGEDFSTYSASLTPDGKVMASGSTGELRPPIWSWPAALPPDSVPDPPMPAGNYVGPALAPR